LICINVTSREWRDRSICVGFTREIIMDRILAATDGSDRSLGAVKVAAELAVKLDADLVILAVDVEPSAADDAGLVEFAKTEHFRDLADVLPIMRAEHLDAARDLAAKAGAKRVRTTSRIGDPAEEIVAQAESDQSDLVVVGSRGLGRISGLLLGSVSQKVASLASCSVLIVRSPA
jgi:nucleotide-binding universal stress UspA family protein